MVDSAYEKAVKRKAEVDQLIEKMRLNLLDIQHNLAQLERLSADLDSFIAMHDSIESWASLPEEVEGKFPKFATPITERTRSSKISTSVARPKNPPREEVGAAVREILTANGRPMNRADVFAALGERGIKIQGKDPEMVLSTMLWRMKDDFIRFPGAGYWLKDKPWEPLGYRPGDTDPDDLFQTKAASSS